MSVLGCVGGGGAGRDCRTELCWLAYKLYGTNGLQVHVCC